MQDRAAARGHGVDRHHRRAHAHAGHLGLERPLEGAGIQRHVGGGAAHVEADDPIQPGHGGGARGADDAAGRAGQDRVLALEAVRLRQPAVGLHEEQPHAVQLAGHLVDVAAQDRRQIGVHHRGVPARHQPQQRADLVAGRDLGEPGLARQGGQPRLVSGVFPGMQQHDGAGGDAPLPRRREGRAGMRLVQRLDLVAVDAEAAADLHDFLVEQARQGDRQVEQPRPRLVADAQDVGEAAIDHQQRALALALQQRIGGDRGAHLHRLDRAGRNRRVGGQAEHALDAGDGGIGVARRILAQQLVGGQDAGRIARDDVGEGAAAIDPELPHKAHSKPVSPKPGPPNPARKPPQRCVGPSPDRGIQGQRSGPGRKP